MVLLIDPSTAWNFPCCAKVGSEYIWTFPGRGWLNVSYSTSIGSAMSLTGVMPIIGGKYEYLRGRRIGEKIRTSKAFNQWGDKDCLHLKWEGCLSLTPDSPNATDTINHFECVHDPQSYNGTLSHQRDTAAHNEPYEKRTVPMRGLNWRATNDYYHTGLMPVVVDTFIPLDMDLSKSGPLRYARRVDVGNQVDGAGSYEFVSHWPDPPSTTVYADFDYVKRPWASDGMVIDLSSDKICPDWVIESNMYQNYHFRPFPVRARLNWRIHRQDASSEHGRFVRGGGSPVASIVNVEFRGGWLTVNGQTVPGMLTKTSVDGRPPTWQITISGKNYVARPKSTEEPYRVGMATYSRYLAFSGSFDKQKLCDTLRQSMQKLSSVDYEAPLRDVRAELIRSALDNIQFVSINSIAFIRDLRELKRSIWPFIELIRRPLDPKAWANAWLTYRYGIRLFLLDLRSLVEGFQRAASESDSDIVKGRARKSVAMVHDGQNLSASYNLIVKGCMDDRLITRLAKWLNRWDVDLSLGNAWDLLPYSFVIDWFIPIGEILEDIDRDIWTDAYHIEHLIWSVKIHGWRCVPPTEQLGNAIGVCTATYYRRWHEPATFSLNDTPLVIGEGVNLKHLVDGAALIIQRNR